MKIYRSLRVQLITLLIVAAALLVGCMQRDAGSNRREGVDLIPLVSTSHIAINSVNAVGVQIVV
jgi:hypothetical protein